MKKRFLLSMILTAGLLSAADLTGKWKGSIEVSEPEEERGQKPALLVLKQSGNTVTGTAGPNEEKQFEISSGKVEGDTFTFEIKSEGMRFTLKQQGDQLSGDVTRDHEGELRKGKLTTKKEQ